MEREAVFDKYLANIKVKIVSTEDEGSNKIKRQAIAMELKYFKLFNLGFLIKYFST